MTSAKIPPTSHSVASRLALIDALKAVASQLIVLHHLSAYGPVAEAAGEAAPGLMAWLYDYARIAVQVFLVVGGFLAARALAPLAEPAFSDPLGLIRRRYQRLAIPYLAALALAVLGAALARRWMVDDAIPAPPGFFQGLAHAFLLQGLLGYDSLSAGVWYVAIDFQLFALMVLVLWAGRHGSTRLGLPAIALVLVLALASLFGFNRDAAWDNWAIYFFGSYGLGAAAWWASARGRLAAWLGVMATIAIAALVVDFRLRIAVALAVALALGFARRGGWLETWPRARVLGFLGRISYSVFLVHFPICLLANALFVRSGGTSSEAAMAALILTWGASILAGTAFHRWVESPASRWHWEDIPAALKALGRRIPLLLSARSRS